MEKILIVEDDAQVNLMLRELLSGEGYTPLCAATAAEARAALAAGDISLVLLDLMLPDTSGELLLEEIRDVGDVPVLVVSAKGEIGGKVAVLRAGADDYITKPFHTEEILARIDCRLRRPKSPAVLTCGALRMDTEQTAVSVHGRQVALTAKEYALLALFLQNPGKTFSKKQLFETVWQETYIYSDDVINTHMSHLRGKLKAAGAGDCVATVYGLGYRLQSLENL